MIDINRYEKLLTEMPTEDLVFCYSLLRDRRVVGFRLDEEAGAEHNAVLTKLVRREMELRSEQLPFFMAT